MKRILTRELYKKVKQMQSFLENLCQVGTDNLLLQRRGRVYLGWCRSMDAISE